METAITNYNFQAEKTFHSVRSLAYAAQICLCSALQHLHQAYLCIVIDGRLPDGTPLNSSTPYLRCIQLCGLVVDSH